MAYIECENHGDEVATIATSKVCEYVNMKSGTFSKELINLMTITISEGIEVHFFSMQEEFDEDKNPYPIESDEYYSFNWEIWGQTFPCCSGCLEERFQ